jgi:hypothetical protein
MNEKRQEEGQSLVELVLVLPVLLIIVAGLLDLGRLYFAYVAVTDASSEGAAYAAVYPPGQFGTCPIPISCPADDPDLLDCTCQRAQEATRGLVQIGADQVSVGVSTDTVTVTVTYPFALATPLISAIASGGQLPLTAVTAEPILTGGAN